MKILALGAHPDDVEVCAGGTVARFVDEGHQIEMVALEHTAPSYEARAASEILGAARWDSMYDWPDRVITSTLDGISYSLIIAPHPVYDSHPAHRRAGSIAQQIARKNNTNLWFMDHAIPGGWIADRPRPNHFVDISEYRETKYHAIREYKQWLDKYGEKWISNIFVRDSYYGRMIGTDSAEGFQIGFSRQ